MRTVTHHIDERDYGDGNVTFVIVTREVLHVTTGDEVQEHDETSCATRAEAEGVLKALHEAAEPTPTKVQKIKFEGFTIDRQEGGFYWQEGGYYDTIEECKADIAEWNRSLVSDENIYGLGLVQQSIMEDTHR